LTGHEQRPRIWLCALLLGGNVGAWLWAKAVLGGSPVMMGFASVAYVLGLRHAVDADHIAAIDNVIRKLMQQNRRPAMVGLYFSLGHSTVVALACGAGALLSAGLYTHLAALGAVSAALGTWISVSFLFVIALSNMVALASAWRSLRTGAFETAGGPGGGLIPIFRPVMAVVAHAWHMYPLGFLFGLSFDTASEVSLLGVSATSASSAGPILTVMVFPALFTAGMSLIDTADGMLMESAYGWALTHPGRKRAYNLSITLLSIVAALGVAVLEVLDYAKSRFALHGSFWHLISILNNHFGAIGCALIATAVVCWWWSSLTIRRTRV
jgi:high-affinity nickel-transport protein